MQNPVITVMVKAARQAGTVILRHMNKLDSLNVFEKTKQDYASEVDSLAEAEIIKELKRAYPQAAFLCEESGAMGKGKQTFVIDPLDQHPSKTQHANQQQGQPGRTPARWRRCWEPCA